MKYSDMFYPFDSKYELMQDEDVINKIKQGDKRALNYLMDKYKELVNMKVSKYYIIGAEKEDIESMTPLQRLGTVADIAESVYFLASDGGNFITGQSINVDGGYIPL